jgi:TRAP-type C4-dicarboxylate transport system permease small subunit
MAEAKIEVSLTVKSILQYSAYAAWIAGLVWTILHAIALGDLNAPGTEVAGSILYGIMLTLLAGGVLYGLYNIIDLMQGKEKEEEQPEETEPK